MVGDIRWLTLFIDGVVCMRPHLSSGVMTTVLAWCRPEQNPGRPHSARGGRNPACRRYLLGINPQTHPRHVN